MGDGEVRKHERNGRIQYSRPQRGARSEASFPLPLCPPLSLSLCLSHTPTCSYMFGLTVGMFWAI